MMVYNNNRQFSTLDNDNDVRSDVNCASITGDGGWWYGSCSYTYPTATIGNAVDSGLGYMYWPSAFPGTYNQALKSLSFSLKFK